MSLRLLDGPAEGAYFVQRAPYYLRAVVDGPTGKKDVLDQLDDQSTVLEDIYVYQFVPGTLGRVHLNRGAGRSGFYVMADYRMYAETIDTEPFHNNAVWAQWAIAHAPEGVAIPDTVQRNMLFDERGRAP